MKLTIDPTIFEVFPDLNVGVVAIKGLDNLTADRDIEAFLRHASLEAGLLLSLKPLASDHGVRAYRAALAKLGGAGEDCVPAMEAVLRELGEGIAEEKAAALSGKAEQKAPGSVSGLVGDTALRRFDPVTDLVRGAEIQFRLPVFAFDVGREETPLALRRAEEGDVFTGEGGPSAPEAGEIIWAFGKEAAVRHFFCEAGEAGRVTGETRNVLVVLPCFAVTRRKAMSVRNELARRMKDSFGRAAESAWLDKDTPEFISEI